MAITVRRTILTGALLIASAPSVASAHLQDAAMQEPSPPVEETVTLEFLHSAGKLNWLQMSTARGAPTFRAKIGDEIVCALFDTGSDRTVVDLALAKKLGLKIGELSKEARSLTGSLSASRVFAVPVKVPGQFRLNSSLIGIDLPDLECADGTSLSLILGQEFINAMVVVVDNSANQIAFHTSGAVTPAPDQYTRIAWTDGTVQGNVAGRGAILKVDTGNASDLALQARHFDEFFDDMDQVTLPASTNASGRQEQSVGITSVEYSIGAVSMNGEAKRVANRDAVFVGNLGYPFFANGTAIFDAGQKSIWVLKRKESPPPTP